MNENGGRFAWARFNAYGILLAGLALLGIADLAKPGGTNLAQLVGEVPALQPFWVLGFAIAGLLLMVGFVRADRIAESLGLVLLTLALVVQTAVAFGYLGWSQYTLTRLILIALIGTCSWARISVLWTRAGLTVTIPPREGTTEGHQ